MAAPRTQTNRNPQAAPSGARADSPNYDEVSTAIERAISNCGVLAVANMPQIQQALRMAEGIAQLRLALSDEFMNRVIMPLRGSALGFLTDLDKDTNGRRYDVAIVRECCVEGMMRGFRVVGNEFNIIAGRFYGAKAGFERQVTEFPGLSDLSMEPGLPAIKEGAAAVPFVARWKLHGREMKIECLPSSGPGAIDTRIPVKVNDRMGPDGVVGKAYRKMYFRIWQRLHGGSFGMADGDASDADAINTTGTSVPNTPPNGKRGSALDDMAAAHAAKKQSTPPPPANDTALTPEKVLAALIAADAEGWTGEGLLGVVANWTLDERRLAHDWATSFADPTVVALPERPAFTVRTRQPGED